MNEFRRDQICSTWTEEQWNTMYANAQSGNITSDIESWNTLYNTVVSKEEAVVVEYNEMYMQTSFPYLSQGE